MNLACLAPLALVFGFLGPPDPGAEPPQGRLPLPAPRGPLAFEPGTSEIGLYTLLLKLAELTGQELALTQRGRQQLDMAKEPLESPAPIPKDEVYAFVEGVLARQGVVIAPITGGTRPILGVMVLGPQEGPLDPLYVESSALAELTTHPALFVRVLVQLENTDARQLQTQLRQLLVDNTGTNQCVPVGELALILQGRGRDVEAMARLILAADKAAGARPKPPPPKESAEGR